MERKLLEVIRRMQELLSEDHLRELKNTLDIVFSGCDLIESTELRVAEWSWADDLEDFLVSKALEGKSVETVKRYRYELNRLLSYIDKSVKDITERDISGYMRAYKKLRKVCNQTLRNVRTVFSSLRDKGRISENIIMRVEAIKVEKTVKKPFTDEEREKMLRMCTNLRDKAILEFLYSTAVRVGELVRLNRNDIKFGTKDLIVYGKGGKERRVYLNDRANMYMREYLQSRTDDDPALFVGITISKRLTKGGVEDIVRRIGKRAGVKKAHPHRFRGTAITNALNRGMPLQEAMLMAGHAKPETTTGYCTIDQESVRYHHKIFLSA